MAILNIAGYKFIALANLLERKASLLENANSLQLKGTILLSVEGININLAGNPDQLAAFILFLKQDQQLADLSFRESYSTTQPFKQLRIKIKKEIITLRQANIHPEAQSAPSLTPQELKQWLDEKRDVTLLDTRNEYEVRFGTFAAAQHLHLQDFSEFPTAATQVSTEKPIVMFCTGGIRCEKAALVMQKAGYANVYQLQGGILNYFAEVGADHYQGECFVFDQRVAVDTHLQPSNTRQCLACQGPIAEAKQAATVCRACDI